MPDIQLSLTTVRSQKLELTANYLDKQGSDALINRIFDLIIMSEGLPVTTPSTPIPAPQKPKMQGTDNKGTVQDEAKKQEVKSNSVPEQNTGNSNSAEEKPLPARFKPPQQMEPTLYTALGDTMSEEMKQKLASVASSSQSTKSPDEMTPEEIEAWRKKDEELNQNYYETGIKHKFGVPHYRCRYNCPKCGLRSNRFIKRDTTYIKCHGCEEQMNVKEATKLGFPNRDNFGNFFVAD